MNQQSPLSSTCVLHVERIVRLEEKVSNIESHVEHIVETLDASANNRWDRVKFIITIVATFFGSGTGLFMLGKLFGGRF